MSHLALPRLHFRGEFEANVPTANNDAVADFVDVARVAVDAQGKTDDELRQWLEAYQEPGPNQTEGIRAGWNYYGDNSCRFRRVTVTRVDLPTGSLTTPADDPLVGAAVRLGRAVMVDLDPEGILGTQIFCDQLSAEGGAGPFWAGPTTRFSSRWLTFRRNLRVGGFTGGSAVWQAAIQGDDLTFGLASSPAALALQAACEAGGGLAVRFCTYLLKADIESRALAESFRNGDKLANPARGLVIGTIGPLHAGEMTSVVLGRTLHPAARLTDDHIDYRLGPAVAEVDDDRGVVSLDLITAFPERDQTLEKVNVGPVSLRLLDPDSGDTVTLGQIAYDRAAYEATAGLVEVPISKEAEPLLARGQLLLVHDLSGDALLAEAAATVETDDRALYLQEGETRQMVLRATVRGRPAPAGFRMRLETYDTTSIKGLPGSPAVGPARPVEIGDEATIGKDGTATVTLTARRPGTCVIRFVPPGAPPSSFNPTTDGFACVRILPLDNYGHVPDAELTYELVYQEVLRYYHLLYPAMSRIINWADEEAVRPRAGGILARISSELRDHFGSMPRTRELSDGKRKLLERWCRLQQEM